MATSDHFGTGNVGRAVRARRALRAYQGDEGDDRVGRITGFHPPAVKLEAFEEIVSDLVADLMHLAKRTGVRPNWDEIVKRGRRHHRAELEEDDD